jgi:probable HAF family extracellular repeat protein
MGGRTLRAALAAAVLGACAKASAPIVEESTQPPAGETATVVLSVAGAGMVGFEGQPPCSSACRYLVPRHASVRLVALPAAGTTFAGWSGACSGTGECQFVAVADAQVAAQFAPARVGPAGELSVTVQIGGEGAGAVRVYDAKDRITQCSRSCAVVVPPGRTYIAAVPAAGSKMPGWTGACEGLDECVLDLSQDVALTATFDPVPPPPWAYASHDVTTLEGLRVSPSALDDSGAIAGTYSAEAETGIFRWDGTLQRTALPDGISASVTATAGGLVVGTLATGRSATGEGHAFVAASGAIHDLGTLGGNWSRSRAVNEAGLVAGAAALAGGEVHAFSWKDGLMIDLGTLAGQAFSEALAIAPDGVPLGMSCDSPSTVPAGCHVVRFDRSGVSDLGSLSDDMGVMSMNPAGDVALNRYPGEAFLWREGVVHDISGEAAAYAWGRLGVFAGGRLSTALCAPNAAGDAVVAIWVPISEGDSGILALRHDGALYDVNDLVQPRILEWPRRIDGAQAVNARGQVLAYSRRAGGTHLLLTPKAP